MSRHIRLALLVSAVLLPGALQAQGRSPEALARLRDSVQAAGGRVIVMLKSTSTVAGQAILPGTPPVGLIEFNQIENRIDAANGVTVTGQAQRFGAVFATATTAGLTSLNNDPNVVLIEPDVFVPLQAERTLEESYRAPGSAQVTPWGITAVMAPESWSMTNGGAGVKVGILDSGGDANHEDLNFAGGYNPKTGSTAQSAWQDDLPECTGHGTHVAGTVAALNNSVGVVGVAPNVSLYAIKAMEVQSGACGALTSSQINGLNWAVNNGIKVVNASLGGTTLSTSMKTAVDNAAAAGTIFVAASGNGSAASVYYPSRYPGAISVGSVDVNNNRASSSNYGPELWVVAPGVDVQSTMPGGGYGAKFGTSMASPHVAGIVALLLAQNPGATLAQIKQKLQSGALSLNDQTTLGYGLARAYTSLGGGSTPPPPAPVPLVMTLSPSSRHNSVQAGSGAPNDSATITFSGDNAANAVWTSAKKKSWTTLTTVSGSGNGKVRWSRNTSGLGAGTYVDTITVASSGATGSPDIVIDTLIITAAPVPLAVAAISPASRNNSVQAGNGAPNDSAAVTLSGDNASGTSWSAAKRKSWTTLTTASGTGSGKVRWSRNAGSLAAGVYVDTITVTIAGASGSPTRVIDTLVVTAAPVPLVVALSPASRSKSAQVNTAATGDSATITLTGDNASSTGWSATREQNWTTLTTASGTGNGKVRWSRNTSGLAVGTYVDTITVTVAGAQGSPTQVIDTLVITAAPVPLVATMNPASRTQSAQVNTAAAGDSASLTITGDNASATTWSAAKKKSWTTLTAASGSGSGMVRWNRSTTSLAVGIYVDTITVTVAGASGSPLRVIDTLVITAAPVPLALALSPGSRSKSAQVNTAASGDSATITLTGDNAGTTGWSAAKKKNWTTLTTASGTGNGKVRWNRNTSGLAVGTYVDTITVTAAGAVGSPLRVIDTLVITAAPVPLAVAMSPGSRSKAAQVNTAATGDSATITLTGDNAGTTGWSAAKKKSWTTLTSASGTGTGKVRWNRNTSGLAAGTYVDTITVTVTGASGSPTRVIDTLVITAAPVPLVLTLSPSSRKAQAQVGTPAPGDAATVTITGDGAAGTVWTAAKKKAWTTFTSPSGTGSGQVAWTRSTSGLAVGTYVDTISVQAGSAGVEEVIDTLVISAAPVPLALTLSPSSRKALAQVGTPAPGDAATVTITGDGAAGTVWTAAKKKAWTTFTSLSGTGPGQVAWTRNTSGLAAGTYVDTISVQAGSAGIKQVIDTLIVSAAPVPLAIAIAPSGRQVTVQQGTAAAGDAAGVTLTGDGAAAASWTASRKKSWTVLTNTTGTGGGAVTWSRNTASLAVGLHVDTITVTVNGASDLTAMVLDSVRVNAAPVALAMTVSPGARRTAMTQGNGTVKDSATVSLTGDNAASTNWTASRRRSWNTLTTASGTASGRVRWTRNINGLSAGIYVDTITVTASGVPAVRIIDTLQITAPVQTGRVALRPNGRFSRVIYSAGLWTAASVETVRDSAVVEGDGSPEMAGMTWEASTSSSRLQVITANGLVDTRVVWGRVPTNLAAGIYVDTVKVRVVGQDIEAYFIDTLSVAQVVAPAPTMAVDQLLKGSGLNSDQQTLLDQIGNKNGRYDLGDFLAWIERGGINVSPALMDQLMALPADKRGDPPKTGGGEMPSEPRQH